MENDNHSEASRSWRVCFQTLSGYGAFVVNINKARGFPIQRYEVQEWAEAVVRATPDYQAVTAIINNCTATR
jgi:hypothetical protein